MKKLHVALVLAVVLVVSLVVVLALPLLQVLIAPSPESKAPEDIYIRADGRIEGTDKIQRNGETFTLSGDVVGSIFVERDNIVVDGADYTLQGAEGRGIVLSERNNVTIKNVKMEIGGYGVYLVNASNCKISGNSIIGTGTGADAIYLWRSFNNTVEGNTVTGCFGGILLDFSYGNIVSGNYVTNNGVGIEFWAGFNNVLRNNRMDKNGRNLVVRLYPSYEYVNDVDTSNTVDGKPVYYWINERDKTVPSDAGCVILVNCTRITAQKLNFSRNGQGIILVSTTDSTVANNIIISKRGGQGIGLVNSSNIRITGNIIQNQSTGIELVGSSNNAIIGNDVSHNARGIRPIYSSINILISDNNITANQYGIDDLQTCSSTGNTISGNNIIANVYGISLSGSNTISRNNFIGNSQGAIIPGGGPNRFIENIVKNNGHGISTVGSNNVLKGNHMENNSKNLVISYSFWMGNSFSNDIDDSNTVNGKPVYYWIGQRDKTVPQNAGCVALINCTNITVKNQKLTNNGQGILLVNTINSTVTENAFTGNVYGIVLSGSNKNLIAENYIATNELGIQVDDSFENRIIRNIITENDGFGMQFTGNQRSNIIYHNSFINNKVAPKLQISIDKFWGPGLGNRWYNGKEGNYWSDYVTRYPNAKEVDGSGIWNTPYFINENNIDRYPLMEPAAIPEVPDTTPPTIPIVSPENKTYTVNNVSLTFTVSEPTLWIGYSLDGQVNVTIVGNTTLTVLSLGEHSLVVYARDVAGNTGTSETVYFSIAQLSEPFPLTWVVAATAIIAIGVAITLGVVIYRRKRLTSSKTP